MSDLGDYIRATRERQGWTARELAAKIGRDASYLSRLETGRMKETPAPADLQRIAGVLNVSVADMLEAAGYPVRDARAEEALSDAERILIPIIRAHEWTEPQIRAAAGSLRAIAEMGKG